MTLSKKKNYFIKRDLYFYINCHYRIYISLYSILIFIFVYIVFLLCFNYIIKSEISLFDLLKLNENNLLLNDHYKELYQLIIAIKLF